MGKYFSDIHADAASQFEGSPHNISDSPEISKLRHSDDYEDIMALADALKFQLRHREAIEEYTKAIKLRPEELLPLRKRAGLFLSILRPNEAISDFKQCLQIGGDKTDILYRLGICFYLKGEYQNAMTAFETCLPLCNDEMAVAVIYWHTLSAWRSGAIPSLLKKHYRLGMDVGHHTAYNFSMSMASGYIDFSEAVDNIKAENDDLEYSIKAYCIYIFLLKCGNISDSEKLMKEILSRDSFWISFAYIAAWNDSH